MCGMFVDDSVNGGSFLLLRVDATLSDGVDLITLAEFQGSEMYPGLFQDFMDGCTKPEHSSH